MEKLKKQGLKIKVKHTIILYAVIPAFLLVNLACFIYACSEWKAYYTQVKYYAFQNAYQLNVQFDNLVKICNNIVLDGTVQSVFSTVQTDETRLDACHEIEKYCGSFYNSYNAQQMDIKIYHDNYSMYQTNYSFYIDSLDENLIATLKDLKQNEVYWYNTDAASTLFLNLKNRRNGFTVIISVMLAKTDMEKLACTAGNYPNCRLDSSDIALTDGALSRNGCYVINSDLKNGLTLSVYIPKSMKYKRFFIDFGVAYVIYILFLVFVFVTSAKKSEELTKKFYSLIEYIRSEKLYLQSGSEIESDMDDELSSVYSKLCLLVSEINGFHAEKESLMAENTKLQLEFAQAQINPHLLYNSLSVIKWDCMRYSAYDISDKISLLADYYRASINKNQSEYSFFNEIELIKKYISVISMIHGTEYKYTIDFDDELLRFHTIQHIFQPLVENAILHGINRMADGHILISGHVADDKVILFVQDNGYGMDEDKLEKIRNYKNDNSAAYGLRNTLLRIKLHYGEDSVINIESNPDRGTKITIILSYNTNQDGKL